MDPSAVSRLVQKATPDDTESRKMMFYCRGWQKGHISTAAGPPCSVLIEID